MNVTGAGRSARFAEVLQFWQTRLAITREYLNLLPATTVDSLHNFSVSRPPTLGVSKQYYKELIQVGHSMSSENSVPDPCTPLPL